MYLIFNCLSILSTERQHFITEDGEKKPQEMTLHSVDHPLSTFNPNQYQSKSLLDQKKRAITKVL